MAIASSWVHGNALTIESPVYRDPQGVETGWLRLTPYGWGAEVSNDGHAAVSWMHLPIPTLKEELSSFQRFELLRVILLGECSDAFITDVHVYDGANKVQEFGGRSLTDNFLAKGNQNTFTLTLPHQMRTGVGLSFYFKPYIPTDGGGGAPPEPWLLIAAAGAEFQSPARPRAYTPWTPIVKIGK